MSAIDRLLANYSRQVRLPWSTNMAGKQRVWFAVYPPAEERRVRAHLPQFETFTHAAGHGWITADLTRWFASTTWSASMKSPVFPSIRRTA